MQYSRATRSRSPGHRPLRDDLRLGLDTNHILERLVEPGRVREIPVNCPNYDSFRDAALARILDLSKHSGFKEDEYAAPQN